MVEIICVVIGLLVGAFVVFAFKRIQDQNSKKSAKDEAERVLNKAKSEVLKIKKDSEAKAKDFEAKARKTLSLKSTNNVRS